MMRLNAVVLARDARPLLQELGRWGVLELGHFPADGDIGPLRTRDVQAGLSRCEDWLSRVQELRRLLELPHTLSASAGPQLNASQVEEPLQTAEHAAGALVQRRQALLQQAQELSALAQQLADYRGLDFALTDPRDFSFLHFVTGTLPAGCLETLELADDVALLPLSESHDRQHVIAMTTLRKRAELNRLFQKAGFQPEPLPAVEQATVESLATHASHDQARVSDQLNQVQAELRAFAAQVAPTLAAITHTARTERCLLEAEQQLPRTESAVLIRGWMPAGDASALEPRIREMTQGECVLESFPAEDFPEEPIPVLLRHPLWLQPFARLVTAYGLPTYRELEPTIFVAVSYLLMFGMMFGDAGHGAVLVLAGCFALWRGVTPPARDAGLLLLLGGLSSIGFGVLYGSCFGLEHLKPYALWSDPLEGDPSALMAYAISFGIVLISLGLFLNISNHFRAGDVVGGLLDKFGVLGLLFYWGVLLLLLQSEALQARGLWKPAFLLFVLLPLGGWLLKEPVEFFRHGRAAPATPEQGGWFTAVAESVVGAFEAVLSYLANTISFVRLAAYALSHAALLSAAFALAREVDPLPTAGPFLAVGVVILGNLVAIALEGVIASVQALRLEYYEFFGKFFSGVGRPFAPFRLPAQATA
jgi:V/A-type H+-transporting ATPase subunit I